MEEVKILSELIEHCGQVCKLFIDSEIALNDGDTQKSVKCNKEGQQLFSTMIKDIFVETKGLFLNKIDDVLDYDYPSVLELSKNLADLMFNAGRYITAVQENASGNTKEIISKKLITNINTSVEIYNCLFNN